MDGFLRAPGPPDPLRRRFHRGRSSVRELAHLSRHTEAANHNPKEAKGLSHLSRIPPGLFPPCEAQRPNNPLSSEFAHRGAPKRSL